MSAGTNVTISEEPEWYFLDKANENKPAGPISERDLDVMWRTGEIDSMTYVWKKTWTEWQPINNVEELRAKLYEGLNDFVELKKSNEVKALPAIPNPLLAKRGRNVDEDEEDEEEKGDDEPASVSNEEEDEKIDEMFMNMLKSTLAEGDASLADLLKDQDLSAKKKKKGDKDDKKGKRKKRQKDIDYSQLTEEQILEKNRKKALKAAQKKKNKWYNAKINSNVYVQGLPSDITRDELKEFFGKCGVLRLDPITGEERIKLYNGEDDRPKGDALVSYARYESVQLAIDMLHEREIRPGFKVSVDHAIFQQKGDYKPREKLKIDPVNEIKIKTRDEKRLTWEEDGLGDGLKIIILKHMFTPAQLEEDPNLKADLEADIMEECQEKLGEVQRLKIYEEHPDGVVEIKFKDASSAEECIKLMRGRWFDGKQIECDYWDGVTSYKHVKENVENERERIDQFGEWLEKQEDEPAKPEDHPKDDTPAADQ